VSPLSTDLPKSIPLAGVSLDSRLKKKQVLGVKLNHSKS
jgi:hypothetical protein